MAPPDMISQLLYGAISGGLTAVLVWISQKMVLNFKKGNCLVALVSLFWAVLVPSAILLVVYLISK
jgi:hypothetical protein